ncbi:MAG TPA: hypothetical protein VK611_08400 [Acidimicrobiales bacterium]|nr:hypothetical protein [Acidimicrobiales bacterium]
MNDPGASPPDTVAGPAGTDDTSADPSWTATISSSTPAGVRMITMPTSSAPTNSECPARNAMSPPPTSGRPLAFLGWVLTL